MIIAQRPPLLLWLPVLLWNGVRDLLVLMSQVWESGGNILESGGVVCDSDACPCGVTCCPTASVPKCLKFTGSGFADSGGCTNCACLNNSVNITYTGSGCTWECQGNCDVANCCNSLGLCGVGGSSPCGGSGPNSGVAINLNIETLSSTQCRLTVTLAFNGSTVTFFRTTILKTAPRPWTLPFCSSGCGFFPATNCSANLATVTIGDC